MLEGSTKKFIGKRLLVVCNCGWGWSAADGGIFDVPEPFTLRLREIWSYSGQLRGGIGQIEDNKHSLNRYWVVFSTRHQGTWNLTDKIGHYNISIGVDAPEKNEGGWPLLGNNRINDDGFGTIEAIT